MYGSWAAGTLANDSKYSPCFQTILRYFPTIKNAVRLLGYRFDGDFWREAPSSNRYGQAFLAAMHAARRYLGLHNCQSVVLSHAVCWLPSTCHGVQGSVVVSWLDEDIDNFKIHEVPGNDVIDLEDVLDFRKQ